MKSQESSLLQASNTDGLTRLKALLRDDREVDVVERRMIVDVYDNVQLYD